MEHFSILSNGSKILTYSSIGLLFLLLAGALAMIKPSEEPKLKVGRVEFSVEIADEPTEWRRGLVDHSPLKSGQGMLFVFPSSVPKTFWMKDMSFPIDIVWISDDKVIGFVDEAQPDNGEKTYSSPRPVDRVLEIGAGERAKLGITVGAPVSLE